MCPTTAEASLRAAGADVVIETVAQLIAVLQSAAERGVQRAQLVLGVSEDLGAILRSQVQASK
jgi:hypothetical protein